MSYTQGAISGGAGGERSRPGNGGGMRPTVLVLEDRKLLSTFTVNSTTYSGSAARCA